MSRTIVKNSSYALVKAVDVLALIDLKLTALASQYNIDLVTAKAEDVEAKKASIAGLMDYKAIRVGWFKSRERTLEEATAHYEKYYGGLDDNQYEYQTTARYNLRVSELTQIKIAAEIAKKSSSKGEITLMLEDMNLIDASLISL